MIKKTVLIMLLSIMSLKAVALDIDFSKYVSGDNKQAEKKLDSNLNEGQKNLEIDFIYYDKKYFSNKYYVYGSFSDGDAKFSGLMNEIKTSENGFIKLEKSINVKVSATIDGVKREDDFHSGEIEYYKEGYLEKIVRVDSELVCTPKSKDDIKPFPVKVRSGESGKIGKYDCSGLFDIEKSWEVSHSGDFMINSKYKTNGVESLETLTYKFDKDMNVISIDFISYSGGQYFKFKGGKNVLH